MKLYFRAKMCESGEQFTGNMLLNKTKTLQFTLCRLHPLTYPDRVFPVCEEMSNMDNLLLPATFATSGNVLIWCIMSYLSLGNSFTFKQICDYLTDYDTRRLLDVLVISYPARPFWHGCQHTQKTSTNGPKCTSTSGLQSAKDGLSHHLSLLVTGSLVLLTLGR